MVRLLNNNQSRTICLLNNKREVALVLYKDYSVEQLPLKLYRSKCLNFDVQVLLDFAMESTKDFLREEPSNSFNYHLAEFILDECVCNFDRIFPLREETKLFSTLKTESLLLIKTLGRNAHLYNGMKYLLFLYYFECHYSLVIVAKGQSEEFNVAIHYDPRLQSCTSARVFSNFKTIFPNLSYFYCLGGDQNDDDWSSAHRCLSFVCWHFCDIKIQDQDFSRLISTLKHSEGQTSIPSKNRGSKRCMYCLLRTNSICFNCRRPFCYEPVCNTNMCRECFFSKETQHIEEHYILPTKKRKLDAFVEKENSAFESSIVSGNVDLASVQCDKNVAKCVNRKRTKTKHNLDKSFEKEICQLKSSISNENVDLQLKACRNDETEIGKNQETPLESSIVPNLECECDTDHTRCAKQITQETSANVSSKQSKISHLIAAYKRSICDKCQIFSKNCIIEKPCLHVLCRSCFNVSVCSVCHDIEEPVTKYVKKKSDLANIYAAVVQVPGVIGSKIECPLCYAQTTYRNFILHLEKTHNNVPAIKLLKILRLFQTHYSTCKKRNAGIRTLKQCPSCEAVFTRLNCHVKDMKRRLTDSTNSTQSKECVRLYFNCSVVNSKTIEPINILKIIEQYKLLIMSKETLAHRFKRFLLYTKGYDAQKACSILSKCKALLKNQLHLNTENYSLKQIGELIGNCRNNSILNQFREILSNTISTSSIRSYINAVKDEFVHFLFKNDAIDVETRNILVDDLDNLQRGYKNLRKEQGEIIPISIAIQYLHQSQEMSERILLFKKEEVSADILMAANYHLLSLACLMSGYRPKVLLNMQVFEFVNALDSLEDYVAKNKQPPTFATISVEQHNEGENGDAHICLPINMFLVFLSYFRNIRQKFAAPISESYFSERKKLKDMTIFQKFEVIKEINRNEGVHYFFISQDGKHFEISRDLLSKNFRKFLSCDVEELSRLQSILWKSSLGNHLVVTCNTDEEREDICRYLCHSNAVQHKSYVEYSLKDSTNSVKEAISKLTKLKSVSSSAVSIF